MRASYLSQDRGDIAESVMQLARWMAAPPLCHFQDLKRLGRYLRYRPRLVTVFREQPMPTHVAVVVDSDHAGCLETRKSVTGMVCCLGAHIVKTTSHTQSTIALNSGESEYYALVKGSAVALGFSSLLADWGIAFSEVPTVVSDSSAARAFASRRGLGTQRHVQTRFLWIQERVAARHLRIRPVRSARNLADVLTKAIDSVAEFNRMVDNLGLETREGSSSKQKQALKP